MTYRQYFQIIGFGSYIKFVKTPVVDTILNMYVESVEQIYQSFVYYNPKVPTAHIGIQLSLPFLLTTCSTVADYSSNIHIIY